MKDAIIEIIKWIRESVRPVVVVSVLSAIVLFTPHSWASLIGLGDALSKYRFVVFLCFTGSLVWFVSFPIERKYRSVERVKYLNQLTKDERDALRSYIENGKRTWYFSWQDIDVARSLARVEVLIETPTRDGVGNVCFEISQWAYSYLCGHPELVESSKNSN